MKKLIVLEIEDEDFRWTDLRRCCEADFTRVDDPQALTVVYLQSQIFAINSPLLVEYFMR
jgi:hypothetical protein